MGFGPSGNLTLSVSVLSVYTNSMFAFWQINFLLPVWWELEQQWSVC